MVQREYADRWGLAGRKLNRDGVLTGWELVQEKAAGGPAGHGLGFETEALSYHLFLHDYGVEYVTWRPWDGHLRAAPCAVCFTPWPWSRAIGCTWFQV